MSAPSGPIEAAYKGGKRAEEFIDHCRQRSTAHPDALHAIVAELTNVGDISGLRAFLRKIRKEFGG